MKVSELIKMLESVNGDSQVMVQNMVYDGHIYLPHVEMKPNMVITNKNGKVYITYYVEHRVETDNGDLPNTWMKIECETSMNNLLTKKLLLRSVE